MTSRAKTIYAAVIALCLISVAFAGGFLAGRSAPGTPVSVQPTFIVNTPAVTPQPGTTETVPESTLTATPVSTEELFVPFWEAWQIVHDQFVNQPLDDQKLMLGAIRGMMDALGDDYTVYMDAFDYKQMTAPLQGEYEGIGAWVDTTKNYLTIVSPMSGTPAEKAGLKPGDEIIAVDGEDMTSTDANLVLRKVLGPAGTDVTLTIYRPKEDKTFEVTITRARITIPSIEGKMLDNKVAYIQLLTFGDDTPNDLRLKLQELLAQEPVGLILDLRNNGGGYVYTAVMVLSEFLPVEKVALIERFGDGSEQDYHTVSGGLALDIPMVVLVNEGTASASEITAGALQDYGRAQVIGVTTFGKGSVQNMVPLSGDNGVVKVTIAHWLTPNGRLIQDIGLTPDVVVERTDADLTAGLDPQLDKAVEILTAR
jgi:carboxyl-terminal processing protease